MDRLRFRRLFDLLGEAFERPASVRDDWLRERCGDDEELLSEARALLELASTTSLEEVTRDLHARVGRAAAEAAATVEHPERIGAYVVEEVLGEGGMGTVYAARQEQPFRREVALKVVRGSGMGRRMGARLEAEIRVLASLAHPHIARIFDAGTTDEGLPYFAMERIDGEPITTFCDSNNVPVPERLELFIAVLKAVGHAHQKAVVHRDIKPSNILVTEFAGDPVPKVIDFGIASVLSDVPGGPSHRSDAEAFGTPAYMSPEAVAGLQFDTRSDVYSLGVLLRELVGGSRPGEIESGPGRGVADGVRPPRPTLPGDLGHIAAKAMAPDPEARYASVTEFAADITRFLTGYPVLARPATSGYKLRRFIDRNRLPVLGAGTAVSLLLVVSAAFTHQLAAERDRARIEAEKAVAVAQFLEGLFEVPDPATPASGDYTARQLLDDGAVRITTELAGQPEVQASLLGVIGRTYRGLGLWREAEARLLDALERERGLKGESHPDVAARLHDIGDVRAVLGELPGAETVLRESLALRRTLLGPDHSETAQTMTVLGLVLRSAGELSEAESLTRDAVEILRRNVANARHDTGAARSDAAKLGRALHTLAFVLRSQERLEESEDRYREAVALRSDLHGPTHPDVLSSLANLALVLERRGRYEEAESSLREVLEARRVVLGEEHPGTLASLNNLAYMLWRVGRYAQAESHFRRAIPIARSVYGPEHPTTAIMINNLGVAVRRSGDPEEAAALHREALAMNRRLLGPEHSRVAGDLDNLGRALLAAGDPPGAEALHREALEMRSRLLGDDHPDVAESLSGLAAVRLAAGAPDEAVSLLRRTLELRAARLAPENPRVAEAIHDLGVAVREAGDTLEAESLLRDALGARAAALGPGHPDVGVTGRELAVLLRRTGRFTEAEGLLLEARRNAVATLGENDPGTRAIDDELAALAGARSPSVDR